MTPEYFHLSPEGDPPVMAAGPFRAVIIAEVDVAKAWRGRIADWLVASGCLYAIAWGVACEEWQDCVDWANLEEFAYGDIPDDRFVMTSWHADQPLSEAMFFAGHCATHPDVDLPRTILLHIADGARQDDILAEYDAGQITLED